MTYRNNYTGNEYHNNTQIHTCIHQYTHGMTVQVPSLHSSPLKKSYCRGFSVSSRIGLTRRKRWQLLRGFWFPQLRFRVVS